MESSTSKLLPLLLVLAMVAPWSCGTSDKLVGRYKSAMCGTEGNATAVSCTKIIPTASAYAVSIKTPPASSPATGTSFPERALAAYIRVLANPKLSPTAKDLRANLAGAITPSSSDTTAEMRTVFHRTIIVTVRKEGGFNPADRLEATDVTIEPDKARFDSWDTLATAYTTINAGTVQLTQTRGMTESLSAGTPSTAPASASGAVSGSQTNTRVENYTASAQAETLSATVERNGMALVIHRQGGAGVDLTGNTVIKVDMSYSGNPTATYVFSVPSYKDKKGKRLRPGKLVLTPKPLFIVPPRTAISAKVTLVYTIRHVKSGDATYEESDDDVLELTSQPITKTVILIPAREASPPMFGLVETTGPYEEMAINVQRPGHDAVGLCFDDYNSAVDFLAYMKTAAAKRPSVVDDSRLGFVMPPETRVTPLTQDALAGLQVEPRCY